MPGNPPIRNRRTNKRGMNSQMDMTVKELVDAGLVVKVIYPNGDYRSYIGGNGAYRYEAGYDSQWNGTTGTKWGNPKTTKEV